jgi:hypothetical protein
MPGMKNQVQFQGNLSPAAARALLKVRFSQRDVDRMNELAQKARAGTLTAEEQADLENYERIGCLLDMLHSQARRRLKPQRTAS